MRVPIPTRVMLVIVVMLGVFVLGGLFSVRKTLEAIDQPKLILQRESSLE